MAGPRTDLFAACAPGVERVVAQELNALGVDDVQTLEGGVAFVGGPEEMVRANLWLRCASRVLLRLGRFEARRVDAIERRARTIPFVRYIARDQAVTVRVTARQAAVHHHRDAARALLRAMADRMGAAIRRPAEGEPYSLVLMRLEGRDCTVSIDTSGELLHRRGYRKATAKAPIRETLAAACLHLAGWRGDTPLVDPMCGSGTFPIEAALIARRLAPGRLRGFAFEDWPAIDGGLLDAARAAAEEASLVRVPVPIHGSDRDAGAVKAAKANARRAGVVGDVEWREAAVSALHPPEAASGPGLIFCNPPYGKRVGGDDLRDLYAALGNVARERFDGWGLGLVTSDGRLARHCGRGMKPRSAVLPHGGAKVRVYAWPAESQARQVSS